MSTLQSKIAQLASDFASSIMGIVRSSSLEELSGVTMSRTPVSPRSSSKRLARRSEEDIAGVVDRIVVLLKDKPDGLRAEEIRDQLDLEAKELPRPLADALASKQIKKSGNKRATTYFAAGNGKAATKSTKKATAKKSASKPKAKAKAKPKAKAAKRATKAKVAPAMAATNGAAVSG